jgi:N-acyl-L-homoserine lactone synthetase
MGERRRELSMGPEVTRSTVSARADANASFSDRVAQLLSRIQFRRADSDEEREAIFRLRYQAYTREGAIFSNSSGVFCDSYDETDNVYLFGLYIDDELASSLRLHVASREHPIFPSLEVFRDFLQPELDAGKTLVDSTRFVVDEALSRLHRGLPYATLRLCMLAAEYFRADDLLAAVRVEHQAFYRRAFNHKLICEARPYPQLAKPISLMTVHYPTAAPQLYRRYPFFRSTSFERRMLFERTPAPVQQPSSQLQGVRRRPFVERASARRAS